MKMIVFIQYEVFFNNMSNSKKQKNMTLSLSIEFNFILSLCEYLFYSYSKSYNSKIIMKLLQCTILSTLQRRILRSSNCNQKGKQKLTLLERYTSTSVNGRWF